MSALSQMERNMEQVILDAAGQPVGWAVKVKVSLSSSGGFNVAFHRYDPGTTKFPQIVAMNFSGALSMGEFSLAAAKYLEAVATVNP